MTGLVRLTSQAHCLDPSCDWHIEGPASDLEARRHSSDGKLVRPDGPPHPSVVSTTPAKETK